MRGLKERVASSMSGMQTEGKKTGRVLAHLSKKWLRGFENIFELFQKEVRASRESRKMKKRSGSPVNRKRRQESQKLVGGVSLLKE